MSRTARQDVSAMAESVEFGHKERSGMSYVGTTMDFVSSISNAKTLVWKKRETRRAKKERMREIGISRANTNTNTNPNPNSSPNTNTTVGDIPADAMTQKRLLRRGSISIVKPDANAIKAARQDYYDKKAIEKETRNKNRLGVGISLGDRVEELGIKTSGITVLKAKKAVKKRYVSPWVKVKMAIKLGLGLAKKEKERVGYEGRIQKRRALRFEKVRDFTDNRRKRRETKASGVVLNSLETGAREEDGRGEESRLE